MSSILRDHSDDVQLFIDSLEKYCLYDKDVFVTFIIFREEPLEENTEFVENLLYQAHAIQEENPPEKEFDIAEVSFLWINNFITFYNIRTSLWTLCY